MKPVLIAMFLQPVFSKSFSLYTMNGSDRVCERDFSEVDKFLSRNSMFRARNLTCATS